MAVEFHCNQRLSLVSIQRRPSKLLVNLQNGHFRMVKPSTEAPLCRREQRRFTFAARGPVPRPPLRPPSSLVASLPSCFIPGREIREDTRPG